MIFSLVLFANSASGQSNRITNRNFNVAPFSAIEANSVGNIEFSQSSGYSVSAEGNEEMVDNLVVTVQNNRLKLSMKKKPKKMFGKRRSGKLVIRISSPTLNAIESKGVGNIELKGKLETSRFKIVSDGVGNLNAQHLNSDNIDITSSGVGNIALKGTAASVTVESDGVGNVKIENLKAKNVKIDSDGVGNVSCHATESVEIHAGGIGNVTYYGNPQTKKISKGGIGKVRSRN